MGRLEYYRSLRKHRRKVIAAFILFIILLAVGLAVADYAINGLIHNDYSVRIASVKVENGELSISIFSRSFRINLKKLESG